MAAVQDQDDAAPLSSSNPAARDTSSKLSFSSPPRDVTRSARGCKVAATDMTSTDDVDTEIESSDASDAAPLLRGESHSSRPSNKLLSSSTAQSSDPAGMVPVHRPLRTSRVRALGYVIFAALNFSLMSAFVKYACRVVSPHEVGLWRSLLAFVLNYVVIRVKHIDLHVESAHRTLLLFRCFIGTVCMSLSFYAMSQMVLTDAVVIIFTSPVLTFLLGAWLLNEPIDRIDFACALLSYTGVFFVARPAFAFGHDDATDNKRATGIAVLCAFGAAATQSCAHIATRKLHDVHTLSILHYLSLFGIAFSLAVVAALGVSLQYPTQPLVVLAIVASAIVSCVGAVFMTLGLQQESAGAASVMRYFDVVFVFVLDTTLLGERVSSYSVFGGAVIIASAVVIGVRRTQTKA